MAENLTITFLAPEHAPMTITADEVLLPGTEGIFTILPGHTPFLTSLAPGLVQIAREGKEDDFFAVSGGICDVSDQGITILADGFEHGSEIDLERAEKARERALAVIHSKAEQEQLLLAEAAIARSIARIQAHHREGL